MHCLRVTYRNEALMGGPVIFRTALLAGGALAATLFSAAIASAQEAEAPPSVAFDDPADLSPESPALDLTVRDDATVRFSPNQESGLPDVQGPRRLELQLSAGGGSSP